MLKELRISNFVLIESLELSFGPGICLLTGETGAGKSIIIDAMEAAMGGRVALDVLRQGAAKGAVEATFQLPRFPAALQALLESEGIELAVEGEITLTREIAPRGTRCRIEGQQVTQATLRQAGQLLVDVLSQHEHQALMAPGFHLDTLDTFGDLLGLRQEVASAHAAWSELRLERKALVEGAQARAQQRDFWEFQLHEIAEAGLSDPHEDEALAGERLRLANVEQLRLASGGAYDALYAGDAGPSLYDQLGRVLSTLNGLGHLDGELEAIGSELSGAQAVMREAASRLRGHMDRLDADPARLAEVEERLDTLKMLSRKYGPGLAAVMAHAEELRAQLAEVEGADDRLERLEAAIAKAEARLAEWVSALSTARRKVASKLEAAVERELKALELPNARFFAALTPHGKYRSSGAEACEFQIAMNPGEGPKALAKTASGGEMARVMLSLKTVLADLAAIPTLIFDEVDTGISGKAAQAVAEKLAGLGRHYQILCITHLPTVAAMADQHVHLDKRVEKGRTRVLATQLTPEARVHELARIASGNPGAAALTHAEELIARARAYKDELLGARA
ncbi:MAG: DNA repair protein RecN [Candidatus Sericytochromatia bacterium]